MTQMAQILGHNCVRLPPYAYGQHMNFLKHSVYVQYPLKTKKKYWQNKLSLHIQYFVIK
jgi:hypothetical protein